MNKNSQQESDNVQPRVGLVFRYDEEGELIKPYLHGDDPEPEVELSPLNPEEKDLLQECEAEIDENLDAFTAVGVSLFKIKSQKLYRETHPSFEAYCNDKWGFSRFHATRLINASKVVKNLEKAHQVGAVLVPPTEACARKIADLTPDEQEAVCKEVKNSVGERKPHAKDYENARNKVLPHKAITSSAKTKKSGAAEAKPSPEPVNVVPMPGSQPVQGTVWVQIPADYFKDIKGFPSLQELSQKAIELDNIRSNSAKKVEVEKLICLQRKWLPLYAEWEQKFLTPAAAQMKEAAL